MILKFYYVFENRIECWVRTGVFSIKMAEMNIVDVAPKRINSRELSSSIFERKMIIALAKKTLHTRNFRFKWIDDHFIAIFLEIGF